MQKETLPGHTFVLLSFRMSPRCLSRTVLGVWQEAGSLVTVGWGWASTCCALLSCWSPVCLILRLTDDILACRLYCLLRLLYLVSRQFCSWMTSWCGQCWFSLFVTAAEMRGPFLFFWHRGLPYSRSPRRPISKVISNVAYAPVITWALEISLYFLLRQ